MLFSPDTNGWQPSGFSDIGYTMENKQTRSTEAILPFSEFEWSSAIGKTLEMVCFAEFNAYLHFNGPMLIQFEAEFWHEEGSASTPVVCKFPMAESRLPSLLGTRLVDARHQDQTLRLVFSNGHQLSASTSGPFEGVQVYHQGKRFVGW